MTSDLSRFRGQRGFALAEEIVDLLVKHDIPATPRNYEIWFAYKTRSIPSLTAEIEARIAASISFDDAFNDDLFGRHFAKADEQTQMLHASEQLARELSGALAALRDAGDHTGSYSGALDTAAAAFEHDLDAVSLRAVVGEMAQATRAMANHNRRLSEQMTSSTHKMDALQAALQSVTMEAATDGLTGLSNRKAFDAGLRRQLEESRGELCLLMCDIDHFKRFNDNWGHLVGDQVIRFIAHVLRQHTERDFLAARYGGEEFAVVMPKIDLKRARNIATSINEAVKSKSLTRRSTGEVIGCVTVSIGIARRRAGDSPNDLIARADACLYASKREGRDRVTTDSDLRSTAA